MLVQNSNAFAAIIDLLKSLAYPVDQAKLKHDLLSHPDYPSLLAINQVLHQYGIDNDAVEVDKESLDEVPTPFIAFMNLPPNGNDFALVNKVVNGRVYFVNAKEKRETITKQQFLNDWRNIAVVVNEIKPAKENIVSQSNSNNRNRWILSSFTVLSVLALLIFQQLASPVNMLFSFLQIAGIGISILLLMLEVNKDSQTAKQFCTTSKTVDCNAVLQSKGAKIGRFSWSEIGFTYFASSFIFQLLSAQKPQAQQLLWALSFVSLPYVLYSIYYQKLVVKQWCKLCLFVQSIIFIQGIIGIYFFRLNDLQYLEFKTYFEFGVLVLLIITLWQWIKPSLQLASISNDWKYGYLRLQNNPMIFKTILSNEMEASKGFEDVSLLFGNPYSENVVIKVCNPFCGPCAKIQPIFSELLEKSDIQLHLIFAATNQTNDIRGIVSKHFIGLYRLDKSKAYEAIHWWYNDTEKKIGMLKEKFPILERNESFEEDVITKMTQWKIKTNIQYTPTVFINNHKMPETYDIEFLKIFFGRKNLIM
jgi:uncharacterized membrane protein